MCQVAVATSLVQFRCDDTDPPNGRLANAHQPKKQLITTLFEYAERTTTARTGLGEEQTPEQYGPNHKVKRRL